MIFFSRHASYNIMGSMQVPILISADGSYHLGPVTSLGWTGEFDAYPRLDHWEIEETLIDPAGTIYYAYRILAPGESTCPNIDIDINMRVDKISPPGPGFQLNRIEIRKFA